MRIPTLHVLPILLATCPVVAQSVLEIEPNDTPATAQALVSGNHVKATYTGTAPTDDDWFSFTLAAPGLVHLQSSGGGLLTNLQSRDNRIAIYDATGTTRLAWNDGAVGTMANCGVTLPAGSYTACVNLKSGAATNYGLDFSVLPVRTIDTVESAEPNDSTGTPTLFTLGQTVEGNLATTADIDFWKFTLAVPSIVVAATYDDGGVPQLDNVALRFWQEGSPGSWAALGAGVVSNSQSHRVANLTHTGLLPAGSYAIAVQAGANTAGTGPWDYVKTGQYSLRTNVITFPAWSTIPEGAEPNNNVSTPAGVFAPGDDLTGHSTGNTEEDWFMFVTSAPTTIGAMAEGIGASGLPGSTLKIYDVNGTALSTASGNATTHGRMLFTVNVPGIYFLSVSGAFFATTGDYLLHTGSCDPLYVSSTTRIEPASTNACIGSNGLRPLLGYMSGEVPAFDTTFVTRVERTIPNSFAIAMLGLTNQVALGSIPLPFLLDMGGLDTQVPPQPTPCYVRVDPLVMMLVPTDAAGVGEYEWLFPYVFTDMGLTVYQQALVVDPTLNGWGFSVTNDSKYVLGDRQF